MPGLGTTHLVSAPAIPVVEKKTEDGAAWRPRLARICLTITEFQSDPEFIIYFMSALLASLFPFSPHPLSSPHAFPAFWCSALFLAWS